MLKREEASKTMAESHWKIIQDTNKLFEHLSFRLSNTVYDIVCSYIQFRINASFMLKAQEMLEKTMKKLKESIFYIIIPYMDEILWLSQYKGYIFSVITFLNCNYFPLNCVKMFIDNNCDSFQLQLLNSNSIFNQVHEYF